MATEIWRATLRDWGFQLQTGGLDQCITSLKKQKGARQIREMYKAIVNAIIYHIWQARNLLIFKGQTQEISNIVRAIREQIIQRMLHLHIHSHKYHKCIEYLSHRGRP